MVQIGRVDSVSDDTAVVFVRRASACGENCAMCKGGCMPTQHRAKVKNTAGAQPGDLVRIETADAAVLRSACLVYLLPILILFLCYGVVFALTQSGLYAAIAALAGLAAGFFLLRAVDRKTAPVPEIVRVLKREREE